MSARSSSLEVVSRHSLRGYFRRSQVNFDEVLDEVAPEKEQGPMDELNNCSEDSEDESARLSMTPNGQVDRERLQS